MQTENNQLDLQATQKKLELSQLMAARGFVGEFD
jgi:hypothetical protein